MPSLTDLYSSLLPLAGVVIGASLQYIYSRSSEQRKQLALLKTQAYVDFLSSVANLAQSAKTNPAERFKLLAEAADAKTRICIYGSKESIALLAEFERKGAQLTSEDSMNVFIRLCSQMRKEGLSTEHALPKEDLEIVLFGHARSIK